MSAQSESSEDEETGSDYDGGQPFMFEFELDPETGLARIGPSSKPLDQSSPIRLADIGRQSTTEEHTDEEIQHDGDDGGQESEEEEEEGEGDGISDLPTSSGWGFKEEYAQGLPGTTPPKHGRYEKRAKKGYKQKSTKKMSYFDPDVGVRVRHSKPSMKKRPYSELNLHSMATPTKPKEPRRHTIAESPQPTRKEKRRRHTSRPLSPQNSEESMSKASKRKRKQDSQKRKQDRDDKTSLQHQRLGSVNSVVSVPELPILNDSSDIEGDTYGGLVAINTGASLNTPHSGRRGSGVRRVQSDAHLLASMPAQNSNQRQYCPPDRKKFYRSFVKALQYSGISAGPRNRMDNTPGGVHHVSRMHSENLALANPFGVVYEAIWLELKAYLNDRTPEQHQQWLFYKMGFVDQVLNRIIDFRLWPNVNPTHTLNCTIARDGYEPLQSINSTPLLPSLIGSNAPPTGRLNFNGCVDGSKSPCEGVDEPDTTPCDVQGAGKENDCEGDGTSPPRQDSVESKSSHESAGKCSFKCDYFLSEKQLFAVDKVELLLRELEQVENLYPNLKRMGDEHPKYRTLNFRRHVHALILWLKVTTSLADKLCSLSSWLGVAVLCPDVCKDAEKLQLDALRSLSTPSRVRSDSAPGRYSPERQDSRERPGILVYSGSPPKSPKSPKVKLKFSVGSTDEDDDVMQSLTPASLKRQVSTPASVVRTNSTATTNSTTTLQRMFSHYQETSTGGPYREFVNKMLKRKGLKHVVEVLKKSIEPIQQLVKDAMDPPTTSVNSDPNESSEGTDEEKQPLLLHASRFLSPALTGRQQVEPRPVIYSRSTSLGPENWVQDFEAMGLPLFSQQYIQLIHVPLDIMHECLRLQIEMEAPVEPSLHSVKQLVQECRDALEAAISIRKFYMDSMEVLTKNNHTKQEQVHMDLEQFEEDLKHVLEFYFGYLQTWVHLSSEHVLEQEWEKIKKICTSIRGGEAEAGRRFCDMASQLLESTGDILEQRLDYCCSVLHQSGDTANRKRPPITELCRPFKELFVAIRERASKALGFAKMLRKDLEIAADFTIQTSTPELLKALQASDYVQVLFPQQKLGKLIFVPEKTADNQQEIQQLLSVSFAHGGETTHIDLHDSYLLLVNLDVTESQSSWYGKTKEIKASAETTIAISEIQVDSLKMVVSSSVNLSNCRNDFTSAVGTAVSLTNDQTSSHQNVAERIVDLKMEACKLGHKLMDTARQVTDHLSMEDTSSIEDHIKPYLGTMRDCFNLGFEYIREVFRLLGDDMAYQNLGEAMLEYATEWMRFVLEKCDRGRGTKPRWATTGLEFLKTACAPRMLATISQSKFEALKKLMNRCVDHVVGEAPPSAMSSVRPEVHPASSGRKPWTGPITSSSSRPPKLPTGAKGFSFGGTSTISPVAEEDDLYGMRGRLGVKKRPDVELGIVRLDPAVEEMLISGELSEEMKGTDDSSLILAPPTSSHHILSPPTSTGSAESGVDGDVTHYTDGLTSTVSYSPAPISSTKLPPRLSTPTLEHMESNTSVASASKHYSSFIRSPSGGSISRSDSSDSSIVETTSKRKQIQNRIKMVEKNRDDKLIRNRVIGHVTEREVSTHKLQLTNLRHASFKWQRGRKLGEGRFGKVYECRNLDTGEMMAVKQLATQEKDTSAIQTIVDEISQMQRVHHENIVRFFGVEVHHNELYLFMEYCNEGTLWAAAQQGLTELMIRRYTRDLLRAVYKLHEMGIVHRDIKGANIFLSSNSSIKLGDFGLSVQLKNFQKTMQNEIKQQVGTVPYMSPEVILKQKMGRPMDIWSVGCVVVEMATGKLPWCECQNQFQIMYQLGIGNSPKVVPESVLGPEGHDFLDKCFIVDTHKRWKAGRLLDHNFVKVSDVD